MEEWKEYPFNKKYLVSNTGFIKGQKGTILKGSTNGGYKRVNLYDDNKNCQSKYVHRMVLETFSPCENSDNLQVNHKDGNKENNNLNNLEWVTSQENIIHARDILKTQYQTKAAHEARKIKIKMIDINTQEETIFNSLNDCAKELQVSYQTIQYYLKSGNPYYKKQKRFEKIEGD